MPQIAPKRLFFARLPALRGTGVQFAVSRQVDSDVETRQRNAADDFIDMVKFGFSVRRNLRRAGVL